ncbi:MULTISPECIES: pyridoxal 5'-phosphate synthase [unclassified Streptomyces]|uniref:pyridoxine/pyridoxamine 5'-phosphate oxidase n=1 Tax=unclassified Streptomyces TaxID=2593676 RepID=UPI00386986E4
MGQHLADTAAEAGGTDVSGAGSLPADALRELLRGLDVLSGELPEFDPGAAPADPTALFTEWLLGAVAAGVPEPHAMTLSTVDAQGDPAARVLILKGLDANGWKFAVHGESPKGRELAGRGRAALTFYWPLQARQVRVRGPVAGESAERSAADFLARSPAARAEALLGLQSRPLQDLVERDEATRQSLERVGREPGLVPPEWTLYALRPESVEFWQGDGDRRHTRLNYHRNGEGWDKCLLWP